MPNESFNADANIGHGFAIFMANVGALRPYGLRRRLTRALGFLQTRAIAIYLDFGNLRVCMEEQYECPNCKQPLPFGRLTDACPKCAAKFGYSSPLRPVLAQRPPTESFAEHEGLGNPAAVTSSLELRGASSLVGKAFNVIRVVFGVFLLLLAILLKVFAHELHLESHDRADLYIPGALAFIGVCLIFARGKASTVVASLMGAVAVAFIWFIVLLIGAAPFSR